MPCRSGSPHAVLGGVHCFRLDAGACAPRLSVTKVPMTIASAEMIDGILNHLPMLRMALPLNSLEQTCQQWPSLDELDKGSWPVRPVFRATFAADSKSVENERQLSIMCAISCLFQKPSSRDELSGEPT